ncbi:MAG: hypothetical protein GX490_04695 [Bacilli bacterium]|nr:hypothetical protein [Bacilli bacterium]
MVIENALHQDCIDFLHDLNQICLECIDYSLNALDLNQRNRLIKLLYECNNYTLYTAQAYINDSPYLKEITSLCAKVIQDTKEECEKFSDAKTSLTAQVCEETLVIINEFLENDERDY